LPYYFFGIDLIPKISAIEIKEISEKNISTEKEKRKKNYK
jgi:hypothetical protein